ncbi:hypothetical protein GCM10025868_31950 [Angustibacter aerolatus]|uniref:Uncharacterized protein n=1 Tax=Angustibacter aerolatus TaxID=1162965 RepID=A0ABQ6JI98_9ACTN|nr:hypothetical protein GCM10025868_31950 [Angustibacter aerolatus]
MGVHATGTVRQPQEAGVLSGTASRAPSAGHVQLAGAPFDGRARHANGAAAAGTAVRRWRPRGAGAFQFGRTKWQV